jgi:hypothetical protein
MKVYITRNHRYRAVFDIPWPKSLAASASVVLDHLVDAGFDRVNVRALGGGRYEAEGVWLHPDDDAEVPYLKEPPTDLGPI